MTEPVGPEVAAALREFARQPEVLVALDFDGCLAPFVLDPADARPLPEAADALRSLAALPGVHLALVSGRPVAELHRLAGPPAGTVLVGSHGAEHGEVDQAGALHLTPVTLTDDQADLLARVSSAVEQLADTHPGVWIEHKPAAAVVHTRALPEDQAEPVLAAAMAGPGAWPGVHPIHGNQVVELAVVDATKGESLQALRAPLVGVPALYAGDDVTDETALAVLGSGDVGVKVGTAPSVAGYRVADEAAVAALLARLAMWRASRHLA
ncbi:trehalose-phosphatase [Ruania zhangjianzhongii]|uniref:trehalose-phosphatase n=1 Tax=Ruania zhangjianzhongii TaxID=2603206 RepID=UPI0011C947AE|nr:trehalose-phosphatase [Ruania zhangjianzhongii]